MNETQALNTIIKKLKELGPIGFLRCLSKRIYLKALSYRFNYPYWHVSAPSQCRPYKSIVAKNIDKLTNHGLIEIGCGLGDISNLIDRNTNYFGIDVDQNTINAAKYFAKRKKNASFLNGSFEEINQIDVDKYDTLLLLNWIHEIDTKKLVEMIEVNIYDNIRFLVIDNITNKKKNNFTGFSHTPNKLIENGLSFKLIDRIKNIDEVRNLLVFEKNEC